MAFPTGSSSNGARALAVYNNELYACGLFTNNYNSNAAQPALPFQIGLGLCLLALPLAWRFAPRRDAHSEPEAAAREPV